MTRADTLPVMIGYDPREHEAFEVCRASLLRRSTIPLHVRALRLPALVEAGLYRRPWRMEGGQRFDLIDGKPFSTDFSFSRFLVPALCQYEGWAVFVDCDFAFLADVAELLPFMDESKAVVVCKQAHVPPDAVKMDGQIQTRYRRKNWSSLMLMNCGHPATRRLTVEAVNNEPGSWLHQFDWLRDADIGAMPVEWNWIDGVTPGAPKAVHYTEGGPWFSTHKDVPYAREWMVERAAMAAAEAREAA